MIFQIVKNLVKEMAIMRTKSDGEGTAGYTSNHYEICSMTIDAICIILKMGLPSVGTFEDRKAKPGGKTPRNRNSALTSFVKHLSEKDTELYTELTTKLSDAILLFSKHPDCGDKADTYLQALTFDQGKVTEDADAELVGVFTGMANIDWLLLSTYNCKKAGMTVTHSLGLLKGIAGYSMVEAMTKSTVKKFVAEWGPMGVIGKRFSTKPEKYMCPLTLTPARLVNCAAMMFTATSDEYVLRTQLTLAEITKFVSGQLTAMRGISAISRAPADTSNVEWMVHRLLLTGAGGDASK